MWNYDTRQWKTFECHMYSHAKVDSTPSIWPDPYFVVLTIDTRNLLFTVYMSDITEDYIIYVLLYPLTL